MTDYYLRFLYEKLPNEKASMLLQEKIYAGVPKGSILDSLLSNIFINDILLFRQKCSLANYADDSTM